MTPTETASCDELEINGCTDSTACNYDASATDDDGSCTYADEFYDCDGNCLNDADSDGVLRRTRSARMHDPIACNFNPLATDDGTVHLRRRVLRLRRMIRACNDADSHRRG